MRIRDMEIVGPVTPDRVFEEQLRHSVRACFSTSPLRGQGPKDGIQALRRYMNEHAWIKPFRNATRAQYQRELDKLTENLAQVLKACEGGWYNWGGPRKVLNILFRSIAERDTLAAHYEVDDLKPYLEVPLDSEMIKFLKRQMQSGGYPQTDQAGLKEWTTIKECDARRNALIQAVAADVATHVSCDRYQLDFFAWR